MAGHTVNDVMSGGVNRGKRGKRGERQFRDRVEEWCVYVQVISGRVSRDSCI